MSNNVKLCKTYEAMSRAAADILYETVVRNPCAAIVLATGHSPRLAYRYFVQRVLENKTDVRYVTFIKLDEWLGLDDTDPATCEYFLREEVLRPLQIAPAQYLHFDAQAADALAECRRVEAAYAALKQIDLVVLGIGMNGHLGLNEPGESLIGTVHVIALDEKTKTHEMLTHTKKTVSYGVTLGMENLFRGKRILLLADGAQKEAALSAYLDNRITTRVPVSLLKLHPDCTCVINQESFGDLQKWL